MSTLSLIVAVASNGVIGRDGDLPWRIPADLAWFRKHTLGKPVIMGRRTWDSLPRKPLPGRPNIVVTRNADWHADGAIRAGSLDDALAKAGDVPEIMVIGGAALFADAMHRAQRLYWTDVHASPEGDVMMPPLDPALWRETFREDHAAEGAAPAFTVTIRERR